MGMEEYENLHHDVGFMWMHTAVADYRLTGEHGSCVRGIHAANLLAGRFNILGNYIRAWNDDKAGWMIVDCLMNLSLLYWATEETKDPRFAAIAKRHADTVYYDSTAGACAACGLLEIAKHVPESEKPLYEQSALRLLKAMEEHFCNWNEEEDGILTMGKVAYHEQGEGQQVHIVYGDYFFAEAILRLLDKDFSIW